MGDELHSKSWIFDKFILVLSYLAIENFMLSKDKFSLSSEFAEFFDEIPVRILHDMLFRMFRFSQVSFNAMTSSFIKFNFGDTETYGRLPWQFCTFTCGIVNKC